MYTTNVAFGREDDCCLPCQFLPSSCYPIQSPSQNASCCRLPLLFLIRQFTLVDFPASLRWETLGLFCSDLSVVCHSNLAQPCAGDKGRIVSFAGWGRLVRSDVSGWRSRGLCWRMKMRRSGGCGAFGGGAVSRDGAMRSGRMRRRGRAALLKPPRTQDLRHCAANGLFCVEMHVFGHKMSMFASERLHFLAKCLSSAL